MAGSKFEATTWDRFQVDSVHDTCPIKTQTAMWLVFYKRVTKVQYVENSKFSYALYNNFFRRKNVAKNLQIIRENTIGYVGYVTQSFDEFF